MIIQGEVISERPDSFMGKRGQVNSVVLTIADKDPSGNRLSQMLEYSLTEEEKGKYAGKLMDKPVQVAIHQFQPFGSILRIRGKILSANGAAK